MSRKAFKCFELAYTFIETSSMAKATLVAEEAGQLIFINVGEKRNA